MNYSDVNKKSTRIAFIFGAGAVENAWKPIQDAIEKVYGFKTTPDSANCQLSRDVYLARFMAIHKNKAGLNDMLLRMKTLKQQICYELYHAQKDGKIKARKELQAILEKFLFVDNTAAFLISTNWDTVIDDEILRLAELEINKYGMDIDGFHIHGSIFDKHGLYLPSEHAYEPYRNKKEIKNFGDRTGIFVYHVEIADTIILYGLSIDPLDAELSQAIASSWSKKLKQIIIINPDYKTVAERIKLLNELSHKIVIKCFDPSDLENEIIYN